MFIFNLDLLNDAIVDDAQKKADGNVVAVVAALPRAAGGYNLFLPCLLVHMLLLAITFTSSMSTTCSRVYIFIRD